MLEALHVLPRSVEATLISADIAQKHGGDRFMIADGCFLSSRELAYWEMVTEYEKRQMAMDDADEDRG